MGGLLTLGSFLKYFPQIDIENPMDGWTSSQASNVQGITVGAYTLGCFFGAVATIWLGNMLGRKMTIIVGSIVMVIGAAIQAASFSLPQLIVSRWITGFGNGRLATDRKPPEQKQVAKQFGTYRHEHIHGTDLAVRDIKTSQAWADGHDRGIPHRVWRDAELLDRPWLLVPRAFDNRMALPNRISNHPSVVRRYIHPGPSRIASLADSEGPRGGSTGGPVRTFGFTKG